MSTTEPAARPTRARRGQGDRTGDEILDAAEGLLLETGDEALVSMRAVAKQVGITPPAIYQHFADKDALIEAVCDRRFEQMIRMFDEAAASADDPMSQLLEMGRAYVRFALENPEPYRVLMMTRGTTEHPVMSQEKPNRGTVAFQRLVDKVSECIEAGSIPQQDPLEASLVLWAAVHGLTALMITTPITPVGTGWPEGIVDKLLVASVLGLGG
jgi:AcrR family transcriptional regulator